MVLIFKGNLNSNGWSVGEISCFEIFVGVLDESAMSTLSGCNGHGDIFSMSSEIAAMNYYLHAGARTISTPGKSKYN